MKKKMYKYVVTIDTTAWDNSIEEAIEGKSSFEQSEILNEDPLIARKMALEKAKSIGEYFEDDTQSHSLPPIKWTESFTDKEPLLWLFYQIKVDFEIDGKTFCIYNNGEPASYEDELFEGLQKEYEILKKTGIDLNANTELVKYYDCKDKKNKKANILQNGMDWMGTKINIIHSIDFGDLDDKNKIIKQNANKKMVKQNRRSDSVFHSTYKHRFNIKKETVEISLKTSSQVLSTDLEKEINALIQKWTKKK